MKRFQATSCTQTQTLAALPKVSLLQDVSYTGLKIPKTFNYLYYCMYEYNYFKTICTLTSEQ